MAVEKGLYIQGQSNANYVIVKYNQAGTGAGQLQTSQLASNNTSDIFFSLTYICND